MTKKDSFCDNYNTEDLLNRNAGTQNVSHGHRKPLELSEEPGCLKIHPR